MYKRLGPMALSFLLLAAAVPAGAAGDAPGLSAKEKAAGWQLLFDGKTMAGWRGFKLDKFPDKGWKVVDGVLVHDKESGAGDIVTKEEFENFDFKLEFRLTPRANSGIKYLVNENLVKNSKQGVAFEYQVLDDELHPDAKKGKDGNRKCGGLYDLFPPAADKVVKPMGQWNEARILVEGNKVEHWLNGKKILSYTRGSAELKKAIAESKFKDIPGYGENARGRILLQDHNDEIAFRNIKIRRLPATSASR